MNQLWDFNSAYLSNTQKKQILCRSKTLTRMAFAWCQLSRGNWNNKCHTLLLTSLPIDAKLSKEKCEGKYKEEKKKAKTRLKVSLLNLCLLGFCLWQSVEARMKARGLSKQGECERGLISLTFLQCSLLTSAATPYWTCRWKGKGQVRLISVMISLESNLWL